MISIKLGGVPEYFNLPIHLAIEAKAFEQKHIDLQWTDVPEGTGAMSNHLSDNTLDLAVILTKGITKSIIEGNHSKILRTYVQSPLIWGVHIPAHYATTDINSMEGKTFAISRFGSGSNLMAVLMAQSLGWDTENLDFLVIDNLEGARRAFKNGDADIFLWEKYTTQPLVDQGEFKRIYDYPTPWPCFVIAANNNAYEKKAEAIDTVLAIIFDHCERLKNNPLATEMIMKRYGLKEDRVKESFKALSYTQNHKIESSTIHQIVKALNEVGAIKHTINPVASVFVS